MRFRTWLVAATAIVAILSLAVGATASNSVSYDDPAGDSGAAADLTAIDVQNDDAGTITFRLTYANRPSGLMDDDQVEIWLDTDRNEATGYQGFDYAVGMIKGAALLARGSSSGFEEISASSFSGTPDGTSATVNRSDLGNTGQFEFWINVVTISQDEKSYDWAPDDSNRVFVYSLSAPRPTRILAALPKQPPKAGSTFSVAVPLVFLEDGSSTIPEQLTCNGTLNGKRLNGRATTARCAWKLPRSAKGKRFVIRITVTQKGAKGTFGPWRFKVR